MKGKGIGPAIYNCHARLFEAAARFVLFAFIIPGALFNPCFGADSFEDGYPTNTWSLQITPPHRVLTGHQGAINSVVFSRDGKLLAGGSSDATIYIWGTASAALASSLKGHTSEVSSVAFSPDGRLLASGGRDFTVRIWDVPGAKLVRTLDVKGQSVQCVTFSPDGRLLASGSANGSIRLWNTHTWEITATPAGHDGAVNALTFSPNNQLLASGGDDKFVRMWEIADKAVAHKWKPSELRPVRAILFSDDGRVLLTSAGGRTVDWCKAAQFLHSRTADGGTTLRIAGPWKTDITYVRQRPEITSIALSRGERFLASGSSDGTVEITDTNYRGLGFASFLAHSDRVTAVVLAPDGQTLASAGGAEDPSVKLWNCTAVLQFGRNKATPEPAPRMQRAGK